MDVFAPVGAAIYRISRHPAIRPHARRGHSEVCAVFTPFQSADDQHSRFDSQETFATVIKICAVSCRQAMVLSAQA